MPIAQAWVCDVVPLSTPHRRTDHNTGQGNLGYTTGAQPPPRNGERTGWVLDEVGDLTLNGAGFIACPNSIDGAWSLWVSAGVNQPGGNEGCLSISARATEVKNPDSCVYTS